MDLQVLHGNLGQTLAVATQDVLSSHPVMGTLMIFTDHPYGSLAALIVL